MAAIAIETAELELELLNLASHNLRKWTLLWYTQILAHQSLN